MPRPEAIIMPIIKKFLPAVTETDGQTDRQTHSQTIPRFTTGIVSVVNNNKIKNKPVQHLFKVKLCNIWALGNANLIKFNRILGKMAQHLSICDQ